MRKCLDRKRPVCILTGGGERREGRCELPPLCIVDALDYATIDSRDWKREIGKWNRLGFS